MVTTTVVRHSNHARLRSIISYIIIKMFLYTSIITSVPLELQRIFRVCLINRIPHSRSNGMIFLFCHSNLSLGVAGAFPLVEVNNYDTIRI